MMVEAFAMREKVEKFCKQYNLFPMGVKILVACSGGADSLALLDILKKLAPRHDWQVSAAHYEHGIRGEASQADARFVEKFCQQRHISFFVEHGDVPKAAAAYSQTLEQAARNLRYAFLERVRHNHDFDYIAVAHHADDQAETVLMRILRGTGVTGLGAMRPKSGSAGHIVRPLLGISKQEILAYCEQEHLLYREDATNFDTDCTRNRLRLDLLPRLRKEYNPEIRRALCQLADLAAEDGDFLQQEVARYSGNVNYIRQQDGALVQSAVRKLHPALQRGLIRKLWEKATGAPWDLSYQQTELLRGMLLKGMTGSQQELPHRYLARISYGCLTIERAKIVGMSKSLDPGLNVMELKIPGTIYWGAFQLYASWRESAIDKTHSGELYLNPRNFTDRLVLRYRRPGDFMILPSGHKKLKKIMIDDKIPQAERDTLPLLAAGSEIIWMIGRRRSARCLQGNADYHRILYLRIEERGI